MALRQQADARHEEAADSAVYAAELFATLDLPLAQARALRLAADCLLAAGRAEDATRIAVEAAARFAAAPGARPADHAGCEAVLGAAHRLVGRFTEATACLGRAAAAFDAADMPTRAALCRLGQGVVLHAAGDGPTAVAMLTAVRDVFVRSRRPDAVAVCEFDLGVALHDLGSMDDAIEYLQQARVTFASLDRPDDVAGCNQNLGVALHAMERDEEARQRLMNARASYSRLGRERDVAQCDHNLAVVVRALGDLVEADRLEAQAVASDRADALAEAASPAPSD